MADTVYKIRDRETGLFSTGGSSPYWYNDGKTWSAIGHVKNHVNLVVDGMTERRNPIDRGIYDGAEIVEFRLVRTEAEMPSLSGLVAKKLAKIKATQEAWAAQEAERDRAAYEELKARFEGA